MFIFLGKNSHIFSLFDLFCDNQKTFRHNLHTGVIYIRCAFKRAIVEQNRPRGYRAKEKGRHFWRSWSPFFKYFTMTKKLFSRFFRTVGVVFNALSSEPSLAPILRLVREPGAKDQKIELEKTTLTTTFSTFSPWRKNFFPKFFSTTGVAFHALSHELTLVSIHRIVKTPGAKVQKLS